MAGFAVDKAVRTIERERRLRVVIETPFRPVDGRVADGAVVGKAVAMTVFRLMARHTVRRRIVELLSLVAGRALGIVVLAE